LAAAENTTLGVVATDAVLTKESAYRLAIMAQAGLARTIRPAHSPVDGDTVFTLATCANNSPTDLLQLRTLAGRAVERAIVRAVGVAWLRSAGIGARVRKVGDFRSYGNTPHSYEIWVPAGDEARDARCWACRRTNRSAG